MPSGEPGVCPVRHSISLATRPWQPGYGIGGVTSSSFPSARSSSATNRRGKPAQGRMREAVRTGDHQRPAGKRARPYWADDTAPLDRTTSPARPPD